MTDDERIARLQRRAYGADTPDAVRAEAVAELAELTKAEGHAMPPPIADDGPSSEDEATGESEPGTAGPGAATTPAARHDVRSRTLRQAVAVGIVALLLGVAVGVVVGVAVGRQAPTEPGAETVGVAPTSPAFGSGEPGTALEDTDLPQLFDRLPPVADPSRVEQAVQDIDPGSVRLLATRTDGPAAYLARTLDGSDVCLVLLLPAGPSPSACTASGLLPAEGLRIRYDADGYGFAVANLNGSGTVTLGLIVGF